MKNQLNLKALLDSLGSDCSLQPNPDKTSVSRLQWYDVQNLSYNINIVVYHTKLTK
ncbi:hypothetical protein GO491_03190 [Flavobacteriaceae bacterium Ap0902]|nr:hypothetical protein [Flavobacteriaceae bacterium Ap0902]